MFPYFHCQSYVCIYTDSTKSIRQTEASRFAQFIIMTDFLYIANTVSYYSL